MQFLDEPEFERIETEEVRREVASIAQRRVGWKRTFATGIVVNLLVVLGVNVVLWALGLLQPLVHRSPSVVSTGAIIGIQTVCFFAAQMAAALIWRRRYRIAVRQLLKERGIATCVPCGYDLRHIESPRCPECGAPFERRPGP